MTANNSPGNYVIVQPPAETITTVAVLTGDPNPGQNTSYSYTVNAFSSSLGHTLEYSFNWGDGTAASAYSTSRTASHSWSSTGQKWIVVTARCQTHTAVTANNSPGNYVIVQGGDDHGDSIATATSVGTTSTTSGRINTAGDNDYFRVQVGSSGRLTVYTAGSTDTFGYLLDSNGNTLDSKDDVIGLNFQIERDVSPGTYYVRVRHYSSTATGDYVLEVRFTGALTDDHGNSTGAATSVGINSTTGGVINYAGDNDYFRVTVSEAGHLTVNTTGSTDTYGYLLDGSGNTITSHDGETNFRIERDVTAGTYYVRVRHYSTTATTGNYQLVLSFTAIGSETHVVLLLHGMNSDETTWDVFAQSRRANYGIIFNGNPEGTGPSGSASQPTPDARGVYYYAVRFGSKDWLGLYRAMDEETGIENVAAAGASRGDYSSFSQLGDEVRYAVSRIQALHTNPRIVIIAHSRGGVAARTFLQENNVERASIVGLLTLGTPHAGSRLARIYTYLQSNPKNSHRADDDWKVAERIWNNGLTEHLDLRRPTIKFLADDSAQIDALNANVSSLPQSITIGLVEFQGMRLGILHNYYDAFNFNGGADNVLFGAFSLTARNFILDGQSIGDFYGDGIVHIVSQRLYSIPDYPNGAVPNNRRRPVPGVIHIEETQRTDDTFMVLTNIATWWNN